MTTFTAAAAFKNAAHAAALTLWPSGSPVQVAFGHPGSVQGTEIVAFMEISSEQEPATLGPRRQRREVLQLTVVFSVFRGGGGEQEKIASDRAYELLGALEQQFRVTDTTVGGTVLFCFLTSHQSEGASDEQTISAGRQIWIDAVFTAEARITS